MSETITDGAIQTDDADTIVVADHTPPTARGQSAEQPQDTAETEADPVEQAETAEESQEPEKSPFWQKLIAEAAFKEREARRQAAAVAAENEQLRKGFLPQGADAIPATEIERLVEERIAATRFADDCNAIADVAVATFKDFPSAKANYDLIGTTPAFLDGIAEIGRTDGKEAAARVYYDLGKDPEKAYQLMQMKPAAMAVQLSRMAAAKPALKPVSKAPAPPVPIAANTGRASSMPSPDDDEAYRAWFQRERDKRRR